MNESHETFDAIAQRALEELSQASLCLCGALREVAWAVQDLRRDPTMLTSATGQPLGDRLEAVATEFACRSLLPTKLDEVLARVASAQATLASLRSKVTPLNVVPPKEEVAP